MDPKTLQLLQEGQAFLEQGNLSDAIASLEKAREHSGDEPEVLESLAAAYYENNQIIPTLQTYDRIIELDAATSATWRATGNALADIAEYAQAVSAFENSLELDDSNAETHHNLARACYRLGEVSRACDHLEVALKLGDSINTWQSIATLLPGWPEANQKKLIDFRRKFARKLAEHTGTPWPSELDRLTATPHDGPLRIGYVCAFFHNANYTKPVWGLINHHDRSKFHISLFSDSPSDQGMPCYQPHESDTVYDIRQLDNAALADLIRSANIDILVDLNAYSYEPRLGLFLRYAAPVNVAWWAMYASSGLPCIEYLVGDDEMVRPEEVEHFSESILKLPVSYLTFTVDYPVPPVVPSPCTVQPHFTFGSLVTQYKITPQVTDAWCEILRRVPDSRLIMANSALKSPQNRNYVLEQFEKRGITTDRLELHGPSDHATYLRHYDRIDLALDAFPYNGGTTTMEAMWQGVPVLTFDGDRWISRTSQTLLRRCHLGEFVANDVDDMIQRGVHWGNSKDAHTELARMRLEMRDQLAGSSACDTKALSRSMEDLYTDIWKRALGDV